MRQEENNLHKVGGTLLLHLETRVEAGDELAPNSVAVSARARLGQQPHNLQKSCKHYFRVSQFVTFDVALVERHFHDFH